VTQAAEIRRTKMHLRSKTRLTLYFDIGAP